MGKHLNRRDFIRNTGWSKLGAGLVAMIKGDVRAATSAKPGRLRMSLSEESLRQTILAGHLDHLDFPRAARHEYGFSSVEYSSRFFAELRSDREYLSEMKRRADDSGVTAVQLVVAGEGALGHPEHAERSKAVEAHRAWIEAAAFLGCTAMRVPIETANIGSFDEQEDRAADGLWRLAESAAQSGLSVLVFNGEGMSSNPGWLAGVIRKVNLSNCGLALQLGRDDGTAGASDFRLVSELLPFARSANVSLGPDGTGENAHTAYAQALKRVTGAENITCLHIEYDGSYLPEPDGIRATRQLLEAVTAPKAAPRA